MRFRIPGQELRADWVKKENVSEQKRGDYWAWHDAIKAAREDHQGDQKGFRPDLILLEEEGIFVAMAMAVASEEIMAVIEEKATGALVEAYDVGYKLDSFMVAFILLFALPPTCHSSIGVLVNAMIGTKPGPFEY